jgi:hypothetical protein
MLAPKDRWSTRLNVDAIHRCKLQTLTVIPFYNRLFNRLQYMRIPFMIMDGLVIYGLQQTENRMKTEKAVAEKQDDVKHEETKKNTRAQKSAMRKQQKQTEKKVLQTSGKANFGPTANIHQPDKSKKAL